MILRIAKNTDIPQIQKVRNAVKENMRSNPALVTDADVAECISKRGRGWVCEISGSIVGFAIADLKDNNIWALFVHPDHEKKGIGNKLHEIMLDWYFSKTREMVWLSTSPCTRADSFYRNVGWKVAGKYGKGEIKFEMTVIEWSEIRTKKQN